MEGGRKHPEFVSSIKLSITVKSLLKMFEMNLS